MENYKTGTGQHLLVHELVNCLGEHCSIHNPSDHKMKSWPTNWRVDTQLMERICPHGIGHPDPDGLEYMRKVYMGGRHSDHVDSMYGVHGCDGCCHETR